jgi:hypothetical protein
MCSDEIGLGGCRLLLQCSNKAIELCRISVPPNTVRQSAANLDYSHITEPIGDSDLNEIVVGSIDYS